MAMEVDNATEQLNKSARQISECTETNEYLQELLNDNDEKDSLNHCFDEDAGQYTSEIYICLEMTETVLSILILKTKLSFIHERPSYK